MPTITISDSDLTKLHEGLGSLTYVLQDQMQEFDMRTGLRLATLGAVLERILAASADSGQSFSYDAKVLAGSQNYVEFHLLTGVNAMPIVSAAIERGFCPELTLGTPLLVTIQVKPPVMTLSHLEQDALGMKE